MVVKEIQHSASRLMRGAAAIATITLFATTMNVFFFRTRVPWLFAMNLSTGVSFLLSFFSFHLLLLKRDKPNFRVVGYCVIGLMILIAGYRITAMVLNLPSEIDLVPFQKEVVSPVSERFVSTMSVITSACFLLIGIALFTVRKFMYFSQSLALTVLAMSFLSLLCYVYQVPEFHGTQPILPLVVSTSLCLSLVSLALLLSHSNGLLQTFIRNYVAGRMSKLAVAMVIITPIVLGYFLLRLHWKSITSAELGIAMLVTLIIAVFMVVINYNVVGIKHQEFTPKHLGDEPVSIQGIVALGPNITESKRNERIMHQNEINLRAVFESTDDGLILVDKHNIIIQMNAKAWITWTRPFKIGRNVLDFIPGERKNAFRASLAKAAKGEIIRYDIELGNPGESKWYGVSISPVQDGGEVSGCCITMHDLSSLKEIEISLRESEGRFRAMVENSTDVFTVRDVQGNVRYASPNVDKVLGYDPGEFRKLDLIDLIHPDFVDSYNTLFRRIEHQGGGQMELDIRARHKDGRWIHVEGCVFNLTEIDGIHGILSIFHDVTTKKKAEEELYQNKLLLDKANEIANIGYWTYNPINNETFWNDQTLRIMGLPPDFKGGFQGYLHLIHPLDIDLVTEALEATVTHEQPFNIDHRIVFPDGAVRWIHEEAKVTHDEENKVSMILGVVQDISERKSVEEILVGYNEKFEILSKATNDAIYDWDMRNNHETWNHGFRDIFGYKHLEIADVKDWQRGTIHADDYLRIMNDIDEYIDKKLTNWTGTYRYKSSEGGYKHVLDRGYIIYHDQEAIRMIGALQDITQRVESTAEIEKLSLVASKASNAVTITDIEGRIEWVNDSFTNITGYAFEEVKGRKMNFLQGADTDPITLKKVSEQLKRREPVSVELINYRKSGEKFWLKLAINPVFNDDGELKNFISIQSDISELKEFENSITAIARELTSLIENANVPIFGVDAHGNFNEWNHVAAELSRYTRHEMIGTHWSERLFVQPSADAFAAMIEIVLSGEAVDNLEMPLITKKRKKLMLLLSASPRRNSKHEIMGVIIVAQNISELTEYRDNLEIKVSERTKALNEALNKERELVEIKSRLVSIASHEFRTPLATIAAATGLIRKHQLKLSVQEIQDKLLLVEKQVSHMSHMLDDVLLLDKANAGKMKVLKNKLDLFEFVKNLSQEVVVSRGNTHRVTVEENLILRTVLSDEKILRSILINLLTNAIKFSSVGRDVKVLIKSDAEHFSISVKDFGIGIPEGDLKNLFEPFFRGENANTIQGTGLGLSIIKKSVDLLSGVIVVHSVMHEGTEFTITIPISDE